MAFVTVPKDLTRVLERRKLQMESCRIFPEKLEHRESRFLGDVEVSYKQAC